MEWSDFDRAEKPNGVHSAPNGSSVALISDASDLNQKHNLALSDTSVLGFD